MYASPDMVVGPIVVTVLMIVLNMVVVAVLMIGPNLLVVVVTVLMIGPNLLIVVTVLMIVLNIVVTALLIVVFVTVLMVVVPNLIVSARDHHAVDAVSYYPKLLKYKGQAEPRRVRKSWNLLNKHGGKKQILDDIRRRGLGE